MKLFNLQSKWKQWTPLVILYDGLYIYRYIFSIFQHTFIGWVWGDPAVHLYQNNARDHDYFSEQNGKQTTHMIILNAKEG